MHMHSALAAAEPFSPRAPRQTKPPDPQWTGRHAHPVRARLNQESQSVEPVSEPVSETIVKTASETSQ
jgi:hypothetical protein